MTLQEMLDRVLKRRLGINEPTVSLAATTLYEEGDGADERLRVNLPKVLKVIFKSAPSCTQAHTQPRI